MLYERFETEHGLVWVEQGRDYRKPEKSDGVFAWDTETKTLFDGVVIGEEELKEKSKELNQTELRKHLSCRVWAWQVFDRENGFFMANNFADWCEYLGRAGLLYGYNYNATFDHSQIDWVILSSGWTKRKQKEDGGEVRQPNTFRSLHSSEGARYQYDLWFDYKNNQRHKVQRHVVLRDFCKLVPGGLDKALESFKPIGRDGKPIVKLKMAYQEVDEKNPSDDDLDYCRVDVEGLCECVYLLNDVIEEMTNGEQRLICSSGKPNVVTGGGLAKRALLQALYSDCPERFRLSRFQDRHPITVAEDKMWRDLHLLRGGIANVNPEYKGKWGDSHLWVYDVNSLYPFVAASMPDLVGHPYTKSLSQWKKMSTKENYEAVYVVSGVIGKLKPGMCPVWYDVEKQEYVSDVFEEEPRAFFECELKELEQWYDLEYTVRKVYYWKKREGVYTEHFKRWYQVKADAKKSKNMALSAMAKLVLNGGIGKFSEKLERTRVEYQMTSENVVRAFSMVDENGIEQKELSEDGRMSVVIGSFVTALARTYMLKTIRECFGENTSKFFVYMDTDSIHTIKELNPEFVDNFRLGALKIESECRLWCYLLPKTYFEIEDSGKFSVHTKGVNVKAVRESLQGAEKEIKKKFNYDVQFECLCAMNVQGGKVLVPVRKYIARKELAPDWWASGYDGNYFGEI